MANILILTRYLVYDLAFISLFFPSALETNLTSASPTPNSEKATKIKIVDKAKLYNPNNSGNNNLAIIIVKNKEPIFAIELVESW